MRMMIFFLWGIAGALRWDICFAQTDTLPPAVPLTAASAPVPAGSTDSASLPETFVNQVFRIVVDSSFSKYYLAEKASPCSFVRFEYDEWVKYALKEMVTMEVLNELARKSYEDPKPSAWRQGQLLNAVCIGGKKIDSILDPAIDLRRYGLPALNGTGKDANARRKKVIHRRFEKWSKLPPQERTVYFFSKPQFTDDGQYAIIDLDYRCDAKQCGAGSTCLFRRTAKGWELIGKQVR